MSRKTYCDVCTKEITRENELERWRLRDAPVRSIQVELMPNVHAIAAVHAHAGVEEPDVCRHCLLGALEKLDARERPTPVLQLPLAKGSVVRLGSGTYRVFHSEVSTEALPTGRACERRFTGEMILALEEI